MAKHLKKLKKEQKKLLSENGYNHKDYLVERDTTEETVFVNVSTSEEFRYIKKEVDENVSR